MIALGIIMLIVGMILICTGNQVNNNFERQISSLFSNGKINEGDVYIYFGITVAIIGGILILIGIIKMITENKSKQENSSMWRCTRCYTMNYGEYCSACGTTKPPYIQNTTSSWCCIKCNHINSGGNYCYSCGTARPQVRIEPNFWKCSRCGTENQYYVYTCKCGTKKEDSIKNS